MKKQVRIVTNSRRTGYIYEQRTNEQGIMLYYLYFDDKHKYYNYVDDGYIHIDFNRVQESNIEYLKQLAVHQFVGKAKCNGSVLHINSTMRMYYTGISFKQGFDRLISSIKKCFIDDGFDLFFTPKKKFHLTIKPLLHFSLLDFLVTSKDNLYIIDKGSNIPFGGSWQHYYEGDFLKDAEALAGKQIFLT